MDARRSESPRRSRVAVLGYDGSPGARHALEATALLIDAQVVLVVCVWPDTPVVAGGLVPGQAVPDPAVLPAEEATDLEAAARGTAEDGAALLRTGGLHAEAAVIPAASTDDVATALIDLAVQRDADVVVVGRRARSALAAALLGSVSNAAVRDGRLPVLVVPCGDD